MSDVPPGGEPRPGTPPPPSGTPYGGAPPPPGTPYGGAPGPGWTQPPGQGWTQPPGQGWSQPQGPGWSQPPGGAYGGPPPGYGQRPPTSYGQRPPDLPPNADWGFKDRKVPAGICGILLGTLGVHKFIIGYVKEGVIMAAVTVVASIAIFGSFLVPFFAAWASSESSSNEVDAVWVLLMFALWGFAGLAMSAVWIIGLVEGITYLTKSDRDFVMRYNVNHRGWF